MTEKTAQRKPTAAALRNAVVVNNVEAVERLLQRGADINEVNEYRMTPLMEAACRGHMEVMRLLISKGAEVNKKGVYGQAPLMKAVHEGKAEAVRLLIDNKAEIDAGDNDGVTALMEVCSLGTETEIARLLIEGGANIGIITHDGRSALPLAERHGTAEMAALVKGTSEFRRRRAQQEAEACIAAETIKVHHALAVKNQQALKARAPKVVIIGGPKP